MCKKTVKRSIAGYVNCVSLELRLDYFKVGVPTEIFKYNSRKSKCTFKASRQFHSQRN